MEVVFTAFALDRKELHKLIMMFKRHLAKKFDASMCKIRVMPVRVSQNISTKTEGKKLSQIFKEMPYSSRKLDKGFVTSSIKLSKRDMNSSNKNK